MTKNPSGARHLALGTISFAICFAARLHLLDLLGRGERGVGKLPEVKQACQLIHKVLRTQLRKQHRLAG